jgi:hypothetical protein
MACRSTPRIVLIAAILPMLGYASTAAAAFINYSDRTAWQTAAGAVAGGTYSENFNGFTADQTALPQSIAGATTVLDYSISGGNAPYIDGPDGTGLDPEGDVNGTAYLNAIIDAGDYVSFTFSDPVIAWGADINPYADTTGNRISIFLDSVERGGYNLPSADVTAFVGFVADAPFTSLFLRAQTGATGTLGMHGIDNVEFYAAVPVPATLALMAPFLVLLRRLRS